MQARKPDRKRERFRRIEDRIRREIRKHPDDLGTLSDAATIGGGGEALGENVAPEDLDDFLEELNEDLDSEE